MIWYILKAYTEIENKKYKKTIKDLSFISKFSLGTLIISGLFFFYSMAVSRDYNASLISFLFMIVTMVFITIHVQKESQINHKKNLDNYKNKVNDLRKLIKKDDYNIYSKEKLDYLIKKAEKELESYKDKNSFFDNLLKFLSIVGMPIILLLFSIIRETLKWQEEIISLVISFITLLSLIYFLYEIKTMIDEWLDRDFKNLQELKDSLESILIWDFL